MIEYEKDETKSDIRDIRNDIERIRGDIHGINRTLTFAHSDIIIQQLLRVIGKSHYMAAVLHLTGEYISASALATAVGTDESNLSKLVNPLRDKGYVSVLKNGRQRLIRRSEQMDMINLEEIPRIAQLLQTWRDSKKDQIKPTTVESTNV